MALVATQWLEHDKPRLRKVVVRTYMNTARLPGTARGLTVKSAASSYPVRSWGHAPRVGGMRWRGCPINLHNLGRGQASALVPYALPIGGEELCLRGDQGCQRRAREALHRSALTGYARARSPSA